MNHNLKVAISYLAFFFLVLGCGDSFLETEFAPASKTIEFPPLTIEEIENDFSNL